MGLIQRTKPICKITGGERTAATINDRLISVDITDAAGFESDSLRLNIDASGLNVWPATGQRMGVFLGYEDTGTKFMGEFKLIRISESLLPNTLTLIATAAPFEASDPSEFKKRRSATHAATTVGEVVKAIALRHGFTPRIHPDLAGLSLNHRDQNNETDIRFLSRLARELDAVCKPVNNLLVFSRRGQLKSLSGRILDPVIIRYPGDRKPEESDFTNASIVSGDRNKYSGVLALWYDDGEGKSHEIALGPPPRKRLRTKHRNEYEAQRMAEAELRKLFRQGDKLNINCPGDPLLAAEGLIDLQRFPCARMNAAWSADRVRHQYERTQGYRCYVEATVPGN